MARRARSYTGSQAHAGGRIQRSAGWLPPDGRDRTGSPHLFLRLFAPAASAMSPATSTCAVRPNACRPSSPPARGSSCPTARGRQSTAPAHRAPQSPRRRPTGHHGVCPPGSTTRRGKIRDHVIGSKRMFPVLPGVAGPYENGLQAGSPTRLDIGSRVTHHPRPCPIDGEVATCGINHGGARFAALAVDLQLGHFAGKPAVRVMRTDVDGVEVGACGSELRVRAVCECARVASRRHIATGDGGLVGNAQRQDDQTVLIRRTASAAILRAARASSTEFR